MRLFQFLISKRSLTFLGLFIVLLIIPITIDLSFQDQDIRQQAATTHVYPLDTIWTKSSNPTMTQPGYLLSVIDPVFQTQITRITDMAAFNTSERYLRHLYSKRSAWNSDESYLFIGYTKTGFLLDGTTYKIIKTIAHPAAPIWSNKTPALMYGSAYSNQLISLNVDTGVRTTIATFPGISELVIGGHEGNLSDNDRYVPLQGIKEGKTQILIYDMVTKTTVGTYVVEAGVGLDNVMVSHSGKYVVVQWSVPGAGRQQGKELYTTTMSFVKHLSNSGSHSDMAFDITGDEVLVDLSDCTKESPYPCSTRSGVAAHSLTSNKSYAVASKTLGLLHQHVSGRNIKRPGWSYFSSFVLNSSGSVDHGEVFALKLDPSGNPDKPVSERFAHSQNTYNIGYSGEVQASVSSSGDRVIFASDWNKGVNAPIYSYVATAVQANNTSTPTPTKSPTPTKIPTATPTNVLLTPTKVPTSTPNPQSTKLSFNGKFHGIGTGGDNVTENSGGNKTPKTTVRNVHIELYNSQNKLIKQASGTVTYRSATGDFAGVVDIGTGIVTGDYIVTVKSDRYLRRRLPGIQRITTGITNTIPSSSLINGDSNGDNMLSILDYNIIIDCYSDFNPVKNCSDPTKKSLADLTDDNNVNSFDLNLFLREVSVVR